MTTRLQPLFHVAEKQFDFGPSTLTVQLISAIPHPTRSEVSDEIYSDMEHTLGFFSVKRALIVIETEQPHSLFTLVHELGHALGQQVAVDANWNSDAFANAAAMCILHAETVLNWYRLFTKEGSHG